MVVEVDGSQHLDASHAQHDAYRDECLASQGLIVLRFTNLQVLKEQNEVLEAIFRTLEDRLKQKTSLSPPFVKEDSRYLPLYERGIMGDLTL